MRKSISLLCGPAIALLLLNPIHAQPLLWSKHIGSGNGETIKGMAVDSAGNIYMTGWFYSTTTDFDPGPGVFNMSTTGFDDAFVLKFTAAGNFLWAKRLGGAGDNQGLSLALDAAGNIYTTGYFSGTADFDPGPGTSNLIAGTTETDAYISKLDNNGNFVWARRFGGTGDERGNSIAVDNNGNVLITGPFDAAGDFDPGTGVVTLTPAGDQDIFVAKLNSAGNLVFAKRMGGTTQDYPYAIATDASGNVYTTGIFYTTADFDPGTGTFNLVAAGQHDAFISKLDNNGNFIYAKAIQGTYFDAGFAITVDRWNNLYVGGSAGGVVDFDPGPGTFTYNTFVGSDDAFIVKLNSSGNFIWAKAFGAGNWDLCRSMTTDSLGNLYTSGDFLYTVDFDPGPGTYNLTANGPVNDVFILKLDSAGDFRWARNFGGTANEWAYTIRLDRSQNVHLSGEFAGVCDVDPEASVLNFTAAGTNDIYFTKYNPCWNVLPDTLAAAACDSFTYNSSTYFSSGMYAHRFVTSGGCDSIVFLDLTIQSASGSTDSVIACGAYTWIDGNTYTTSNNTATHTLINSQGCDSIVTLDLQLTALNDSVMQSGNTLTAFQTGATYQWLDCLNGYQAIPNDTGQSFTPALAGEYAVSVTIGNCTDTSACVNMLSLGANAFPLQSGASFYPNPAADVLNVIFPAVQRTAFEVRLSDVHGRLLKRAQHAAGTPAAVISLEAVPPGVYIVEISDGVRSEKGKLVVR